MRLPFLPPEIKTESPLYKRAFTLSVKGKPAAYERLEFLGDRVLGLFVAEMLYKHFPQENEGDWAMRFTILVREETLAGIALQLGFPDLIIGDEHDLEIRHNSSILADVLEAFIAAYYLDQGAAKTRAFIAKYWGPLLNRSHETIKDAKSALQEWSQKYAHCVPIYETLSRTGPDHAPIFEIQALIPGFGSAMGVGASKREAMQQAAEKLLHSLPPQNQKKHQKNKKSKG